MCWLKPLDRVPQWCCAGAAHKQHWGTLTLDVLHMSYIRKNKSANEQVHASRALRNKWRRSTELYWNELSIEPQCFRSSTYCLYVSRTSEERCLSTFRNHESLFIEGYRRMCRCLYFWLMWELHSSACAANAQLNHAPQIKKKKKIRLRVWRRASGTPQRRTEDYFW